MKSRDKTRDTKATRTAQDDIQHAAEEARSAARPKRTHAAQSGTRRQPTAPLPKQHQKKPGHESELSPQPRFMAPDYRGSGKLKGMVALITGGDSGIGRAVAVLFAREGADVAIVYLSEDQDAKATAKHVEQEGSRCLLLAGDVRKPDFCRAAVDRTVHEFGQLDILVNNAAFQEHVDSLEDLTDAHFDMTLKTNVYGYFNMARAALPHLREGSSIINTGSETGLFGSPGLIDYATTKGAIHAFTKALASNLVERGIRVNAVAPGPVWTPLNPADQSREKIRNFGASSAMGRAAQPEELSPAYVFLAAPVCSSYISGAILPVLGGPKG